MSEEWKKLIEDYNRDNAYIRHLKYKWVTPKSRKVKSKPKK